jgi:hypothetical protein
MHLHNYCCGVNYCYVKLRQHYWINCAIIFSCTCMYKILLAAVLCYYPACAHAQQGVKQSVCPSVCLSVDTKIAISRDLGTWVIRNYNKSIELGENWLQYVSNRGIGSNRVTNTAFLLPIVATPIETTAHAWTGLSCVCSIERISEPFAMHRGMQGMHVLYEL